MTLNIHPNSRIIPHGLLLESFACLSKLITKYVYKADNALKYSMVKTCPRCHRKFGQKSHLTAHLARKKPCSLKETELREQHTCTDCENLFKYASNLTRHKHDCQGPKLTPQQLITNLREQLQHAQEELAAVKDEALVTNSSDKLELVSCEIGTVGEVFGSAIYFGEPGPLLIPESEVSGCIVKFGQSVTVPERISTHSGDFGGFKLLDCFKTINPIVVEQRIKRVLDMNGRRLKAKTVNKAYRDTELIVVSSQQEYTDFVRQCKSIAEDYEMEILGITRAVWDAKTAAKESEIKALTLQVQQLELQLS